MTHFLRNKSGDTIVDIEEHQLRSDAVAQGDGQGPLIGDFHVDISIKNFAVTLLALEADNRPEFILDMKMLQELRREWWERPLPRSIGEMRAFIVKRLEEVATIWELSYVSD